MNKYVQKLVKKFPHFDFSLFYYKNSYTKSTVICKKHGKFENSYKELIRQKYGCPTCVKNKLKVPKVINKVCEKHGEYKFNRYNSSNCPVCRTEGRKLTHEEFIKKLEKGNKYYRRGFFEVVGEYIKSSDYIEVRTIYGSCLVTGNHLLKGKKPTIRTAKNKTDYAIKEFKERYQNDYAFKDFCYETSRKPFYINCKKHGDFKTSYTNLKIRGCPACGYEKIDIGFTKEDFIRICGNRTAKLYLIEIKSEKESFIKIGITCRNLKERFPKLNYKVINVISSKDAGDIFEKEKSLHTLLKKYKYIPKNKFRGYTECYKKKYLNRIKNEFTRV